MAMVSNQWLKPLISTTRDPWHVPNTVEIARDHVSQYHWARANEMAAVFKLSLRNGEYQVLAFTRSEAGDLVGELAPQLEESASVELALKLLNELPERACLSVVSKAVAKLARRAAR